MKYLYSKEFTDTFGVEFSNNISTFVQQHVITHENCFLYCNWNTIMHCGEYSNTPLEGNNFGINHSAISTHPGLAMDSSMVILSVQSDKHVVKTNSKVVKANKKNCVNFTEKVHSKLTVMASSMLSNLLANTFRYESIRINDDEWLVRNKEVQNSSKKLYIPDFDVVQKITSHKTQEEGLRQLKCTCHYAEVYGLPCVHSIVVASSLKPRWKQITHNDVSVRWWKAYYLFSLPEKIIPDRTKQMKIKQVFKSLRRNETVGIHVKVSDYINQSIHDGPIPDEYSLLPHVVRCTNYPDSNKVSDFDPFNSNLDGTMSQLTDINTELSDEENQDDGDVFAFVASNIQQTIKNDAKTKSFYAQLKPNFSEAVNWISTQDEVEEFAKLMDSFVSSIKQKYNPVQTNTTSHTYVSSNLPIERSRKHHGCDGYIQNKRTRK